MIGIEFYFFKCRYLLRSGNNEHPLDRFYNTSVEALPVSTPDALVAKKFRVLPDGFYSIGLCIFLTSEILRIIC